MSEESKLSRRDFLRIAGVAGGATAAAGALAACGSTPEPTVAPTKAPEVKPIESAAAISPDRDRERHTAAERQICGVEDVVEQSEVAFRQIRQEATDNGDGEEDPHRERRTDSSSAKRPDVVQADEQVGRRHRSDGEEPHRVVPP